MTAPQPTRSAVEIAERTAVSDVVVDIFRGLTAADLDQDFSELFNSKSARQFLERLGSAAELLTSTDNYEQALTKIDNEIARLESVRDQLLSELFKKVRPLERSYRELNLFFANADVPTAKMQEPIEFYVFNADVTAMTEPTESETFTAVKNWIKKRNDSFNFRTAISNLVVPGYVKENVRKALEIEADRWGMLLIGDLSDEKTFDDLLRQFNPDDGKYTFLKRPQDQAASNVILANWLKLRDRHWFEEDRGGTKDGLYGPSSMMFAGALIRSDRTATAGISQGPIGMRYGKISGAEKARFEPLVSETEHLTMDRQLITIVRNADNDLCFMGARSQADDPKGTQKFFSTYRVFRFIERMVENYVRQVAYEKVNRRVVDERVLEPLRDFFEDLQKNEVIQRYELNHEYNEDEYAQGVVSLDISLKPMGPAEDFKISIGAMEAEQPT